jgi:uncharacterized integral membrane protein (TIGR00698 family)
MRRLGPGLFLTIVVALISAGLGAAEEAGIGEAIVEPLVLALLIGVLLRAIVSQPTGFVPGTSFAAKPILEFSIVLIGASIDVRAIFAPGLLIPVIVIAGVATSLLVSFGIGLRLRLGRNLAVLIAVGNSICGNSAIVAVGPIIGATENEVASAIALTAVLGVVLILALPLTILAFSLTQPQYGVLAGMSVYSLPQVVAAAFRVGESAGNVATVVKLTRIILLGPTVIAIAAMAGRGQTSPGSRLRVRQFIPWFVVGFAVLAIGRSTGLIPAAWADAAHNVSAILTILAMAGLGFGVELGVVRTVGFRVGAAVVLSLCFMIAFTLSAVLVLPIN